MQSSGKACFLFHIFRIHLALDHRINGARVVGKVEHIIFYHGSTPTILVYARPDIPAIPSNNDMASSRVHQLVCATCGAFDVIYLCDRINDNVVDIYRL